MIPKTVVVDRGAVRIEEVDRYLTAGSGRSEAGLRRRTEALLAEAPLTLRGAWGAEGDEILLCGTVGPLFDRWQRALAVRSAADALIAQAIGTAAVEAVMDALEREAKSATPGEWERRRSPGYGKLPLSESDGILARLGATRWPGVVCSADHLLIPAKSVTAVCRRRPEG